MTINNKFVIIFVFVMRFFIEVLILIFDVFVIKIFNVSLQRFKYIKYNANFIIFSLFFHFFRNFLTRLKIIKKIAIDNLNNMFVHFFNFISKFYSIFQLNFT